MAVFNVTKEYNKGFTIVELLVVIVVIGILAAITVISYSGITNRANIASIKTQLTLNTRLLKMYHIDYDSYPTTFDENLCPTAPTPDLKYCIKNMGGATLSYAGGSSAFALTIAKGNDSFKITDAEFIDLACPVGFIVVPGSLTYGTSDFCVMKYEAKADDDGDGIGDTNHSTAYSTWPNTTYPVSASRKLVSSAGGYPVTNLSQTTATTAASSLNFVHDCDSGCHLISEAEWMTIAQNVLSVPSNWSGSAVGSGYIYSGHNDGAPANALVADPNDSYSGTGQGTPSNQRRTLTLTNGEVIWDFAGNVWEWTTGQITGGLPTGMATLNWYQWMNVSGGTFLVDPYPSGTGLSGSSSWNGTNGIGRIYGLSSDSSLRGFFRGGYWSTNTYAGVLALDLGNSPSNAGNAFGFRVTK